MPKRWQIAPPAPPSHLARFPDLPPLIVQVLYNRGISTPQDVRDFLAGRFAPDNPFRLKGMAEAVTRLRRAIRAGEPIAVYGDFDADGVTATALLAQTLAALGATVYPYIPHRVKEGYGLNIGALRDLAAQGVRVVVTVDCGIRSVEEVRYGQELGLDIIVTDHHSVGEELPPALAAIDPKQPDCPYPFKDLAGVGLAFKLAQALLRTNRQVPILRRKKAALDEEDLLDLVALGTVADLAPLLSENRALVMRGLEKLNAPQRPGLRAMIAQAGLRPGEITTTSIGYVLGPRLNAAGRLDDAMVSYNLLTTPSAAEAESLARELEERNRERQRLTLEMLERARRQALALAEERLFFIAAEDFLAGIVGLVASRLTEEFYRPTVVVEMGPEESRGSCRSIPEFNITAALDQCRDLLIRHGGHAAAAGFTVATANLKSLQRRLQEIAREELAGLELVPTLFVDAEVDLAELDWATQAHLAKLEPCGYANPTPLFLSRHVAVRDARAVGTDARHLKLTLSDGRTIWDAIAFGQGQWAGKVPRHVDIVYSLEVHEWGGERRLQLNVKDLRPSDAA